MLEGLKILLLCIVAAITYGIVHDNITARVCVEYFTVGHPPVFRTQSPTLLALGWGVIATWWVGAMLGIPAAFLARLGTWPKVSAGELTRPIALLLATMAVCSLVAGMIGHSLARRGVPFLTEPLASRIPHEKRAAYIADAFAHEAAYAVGFLGGVVLWAAILIRRLLLRDRGQQNAGNSGRSGPPG
jgi:hypothetical protein